MNKCILRLEKESEMESEKGIVHIRRFLQPHYPGAYCGSMGATTTESIEGGITRRSTQFDYVIDSDTVDLKTVVTCPDCRVLIGYSKIRQLKGAK